MESLREKLFDICYNYLTQPAIYVKDNIIYAEFDNSEILPMECLEEIREEFPNFNFNLYIDWEIGANWERNYKLIIKFMEKIDD